MDRSQQQPWVQMVGRIAVHRPGLESHEPKGASRVLLSILVAAGPDGATIEEIAAAYWASARPSSWAIALRVSASHLSAQLPDGWNVETEDGRFRIVPGQGFIDVWRVERRSSDLTEADTTWLQPGTPFPDVTGIDLVDDAIARLTPQIAVIEGARDARSNPDDFHLPLHGTNEQRVEWIRNRRRSIVFAEPKQHALMAGALATDQLTESHVVVGDRRLLLPLGPFAMAFPRIRDEIHLEQGVIAPDSATLAFRVITDSLAERSPHHHQLLVLEEANKLDTSSLKLASLLIERGRISDFSLIACADHDDKDLRWLDFVNRSVTAGCELIKFPVE